MLDWPDCTDVLTFFVSMLVAYVMRFSIYSGLYENFFMKRYFYVFWDLIRFFGGRVLYICILYWPPASFFIYFQNQLQETIQKRFPHPLPSLTNLDVAETRKQFDSLYMSLIPRKQNVPKFLKVSFHEFPHWCPYRTQNYCLAGFPF